MKRILLGLTLSLALGSAALAQSSPGFYSGQVPTAAQWNSYFAAKQDYTSGALTGPGSATNGNLVTWGSTYPGVIDGGPVPTLTAGSCAGVGSGPAYTVSVTASCLVPRGYVDGLILSTAGSSATLTVAPGSAADSTSAQLEKLASSLSKTISSTWAVGAAAGCLDTGSVTNSTWYNIFVIERTDLTVTDVLCSLSASAPTMPSGYTLKRRIGAMLTNGSAQWVTFTQVGNLFLWQTPVADVSTTTLSTTATNFPLTVPPSVSVQARVRGYMSSATPGSSVVVTSPLLATPVAGTPAGELTAAAQVAGIASAFNVEVLTDTSRNISAVASAASTTLKVDTFGWVDLRGRDN